MKSLLYLSVLFVAAARASKSNNATLGSITTPNSPFADKSVHWDDSENESRALKALNGSMQKRLNIKRDNVFYSIPLIQRNKKSKEEHYVTVVFIGGRVQRMILQIDTTNSLTWVMGDRCENCGSSDELFNPEKSRSTTAMKVVEWPMTSYLINGFIITGYIYVDTFQFLNGGFKLPAKFLVADSIHPIFNDRGITGMLGLGFGHQCGLWWHFFSNLPSANKLPCIFGLHLAKQGSRLTIGIDPKLAPSHEQYVEQGENKGPLWIIKDFKILVRQIGNAMGSRQVVNTNAFINTQMTKIMGPAEQVERFYSHVPGHQPYLIPGPTGADGAETIHMTGDYVMACRGVIQVTFKIRNAEYRIERSNLNLGKTVYKGRYGCFGSISSDRNIDPQAPWSLGTQFLKNVYVVFDLANAQIGFKSLWDKDEPLNLDLNLSAGPSGISN